MQGSGADGVTYTAMLAGFGPSLAALVTQTGSTPLQLVAAAPADGCVPLTPASAYAGKVVLLQRDGCSFQAKVCCSCLHMGASGCATSKPYNLNRCPKSDISHVNHCVSQFPS